MLIAFLEDKITLLKIRYFSLMVSCSNARPFKETRLLNKLSLDKYLTTNRRGKKKFRMKF